MAPGLHLMPDTPVVPSIAIISTACARPVVDRLCSTNLAGAMRAELNGDENAETVMAKLSGLRGAELAILILLPEPGRVPENIDTIDLATWQASMAILPFTSRVLQALRQNRSGSLVVVCIGAQIALTGSSGMTMLSAVQEGQRSLIKAAARQWGHDGFRAHWLGVHPSMLSAVVSCDDIPQKQDSAIHALGTPPSLERIAGLLPLFASPEADVLTGLTVLTEGGGWMVP